MSCPPGVPCNDPRKVYPLKGNDCDKSCPVESNRVVYDGPNLPQSGVNTGDCLTVALEKIDDAILRYSRYNPVVASLLQTIQDLSDRVQALENN